MTHQYHDALDRYEARMRAEKAEREFDELEARQRERCCCLERAGDDEACPIHGLAAEPCTCGPDPDAPACPSCRARNDHREMPF